MAKQVLKQGTKKYIRLPVIIVNDPGTGWIEIEVKLYANQIPLKVWYQKRLLKNK